MNFILFNRSWTFSNIPLTIRCFSISVINEKAESFQIANYDQFRKTLKLIRCISFSLNFLFLRIVISDKISFKNTSFYFRQKNFGCFNIVPKLIQNKIIQTLWDLAENWMKRNKDRKETFSRLKYIETPAQRQVQRELFRKTFGRLSGSSGGKEK